MSSRTISGAGASDAFGDVPPLPSRQRSAVPRRAANEPFGGAYARAFGAWCSACALFQPLSVCWLGLVAAPSVYALALRRGIVHIRLPMGNGGELATLAYPALHVGLAAGSLLALLLFGLVGLVALLLLPPLALACVHDALAKGHGEAVQRLANELREVALVALCTIRGESNVARDEGADDDEKDEIESGSAEPDILPEGNEDQLAKRVEAIRSKYRAPVDSSARRRESSGGLKVD